MYEHHAAIEEHDVFPAWKLTLNSEQLDEMNDKFEEIEHQQFGEDGFENALQQMVEIEQSLGLGDLSRFTARRHLLRISTGTTKVQCDRAISRALVRAGPAFLFGLP